MVKLRRRRVLAAAIETTPGTLESLSGTNAVFRAFNIQSVQPNIDKEQRDGQGGFGRAASVPGGRVGSLSFSVGLPWDGTSTLPKEITILLVGCGVKITSGVVTRCSEGPGTNVKTLSIATYVDGLKKALRGAMGNAIFRFPTARSVVIDFTFTGIWVSVADVTLPTPSLSSTTELRYADSATTWDDKTLCNESLTFDLGNVVTMHYCEGDAVGYDYAVVTDSVPMITANPESVSVATQDRYGMNESGAEAELTWEVKGPGGSVITFVVPKAQINTIAEGERDGIMIDDIVFQANQNGSNIDQEFSITFTPDA